MISKEVLAKVNKIVTLSLTKHKISLQLKGFNGGVVFLSIGQVQENNSTIYHNGSSDYVGGWIHLTRPNALYHLEQVLHWLHTLENRHGL